MFGGSLPLFRHFWRLNPPPLAGPPARPAPSGSVKELGALWGFGFLTLNLYDLYQLPWLGCIGIQCCFPFHKNLHENQEKHVFFWVEDVFPVGHAPFWCEVPGFQKDNSTWWLTWNFILPLPQVGDPIGGHWGTRFCRLQSRGMEIDGNGKNCSKKSLFIDVFPGIFQEMVVSRLNGVHNLRVCSMAQVLIRDETGKSTSVATSKVV